MAVTRRDLLFAAVLGRVAAAAAEKAAIGVASFSYSQRLSREPELNDPLRFLQFCRDRGAAGVQTAIPTLDEASLSRLRRYLDETRMFLEGSARLPKDAADVERFEADVRAAKSAGATVVRSVMLSGRRYETFRSAEEFARFRESSLRSVQLAEPVVRRHQVRLALENHKDYRSEEFVDLLRRVGSPFVGACVDTGNNVALLEAPLETVEALAPFAFSCHLKDMAVEPCPEGFLLSEVPLGKGFLDLPRIIAVLRKARPEIRFNLEMITRDPLVIPCLTEGYWATLGEVRGRVLARALALVRDHPQGRPLPRVGALPFQERLAREDENVRFSLRWEGGA